MRAVNAMLVATLAFFAAYSFLGCPPSPITPNDAGDATPEAASDAGTAPDVTEPDPDNPTEAAALKPQCVRACATLARLGCPEARTPDGGKSCYVLCADAEESGKFSLKPLCVAAAMTVDQVRACKTVRCIK